MRVAQRTYSTLTQRVSESVVSGISYISSHLGPVAAPATCSYLCAHTILHCSAGVALPTSAAPRFAYQMPLLFDSLVYPLIVSRVLVDWCVELF